MSIISEVRCIQTRLYMDRSSDTWTWHTCNVPCHFRQQTQSHKNRCYQTSCCKHAPEYLATKSSDLGEGHRVVKTAGVQHANNQDGMTGRWPFLWHDYWRDSHRDYISTPVTVVSTICLLYPALCSVWTRMTLVCNKHKSVLTESIITTLSPTEINVDSAWTNKTICINQVSIITKPAVTKFYCRSFERCSSQLISWLVLTELTKSNTTKSTNTKRAYANTKNTWKHNRG